MIHHVVLVAANAGSSAAASADGESMAALLRQAQAAQQKLLAVRAAAHPYLTWLMNTPLGVYLRTSDWTFQALQSLHFIGMTLLIGTVGAIDLRVLGVARAVPLAQLHRFLPLAFIGFGINLMTGILFITNDPFTYVFNISFRLKLLLILLSGLNALWFRVGVFLDLESWGPGIEASRLAKVISAVSLLLWVGVIICGRYIAFTPSNAFAAQ
jgi:hypothetical protein